MIRRLALGALERTGLTLLAYRVRELSLQLNPRVVLRNRRFANAAGPDGLPLPPVRLITLVSGTPDIGWFLEFGVTGTSSVRSMLSRNGIDIEELDAILDFGCGCGRMVRHWHDLSRPHLTGTDYNRDLIDWCRTNLSFASFDINKLSPPLRYRDETFNLIYSFSVFTHLPEDLQHRWITELRRILKPGGYLLVTTHGDSFMGHLSSAERSLFERGELVVRHAGVPGTNLCSAFHPRHYLESSLLDGFEVLEFAPVTGGATGGVMQDMTLARKPADHSPDGDE